MADIIWTDVTDYAPELSVSSGAQALILDYVNEVWDVTAFPGGESGSKVKLARVLMAAHLASTGPNSGGAAGPVTSESAGGLSRSYGVLATSSGLGRSTYGSELAALIRRHAGGPRLL